MKLRVAKLVLFVLIFVLGLATIIVTVANGGGITSRGILFGGILCLMAAIRIFLSIQHNA
ncbi:MAG: hypothetical protein JHC98_01425 [Thermoleophilaceae bacterium]|nr:hypothetical protein [Thermoleophilaceae bacterium]